MHIIRRPLGSTRARLLSRPMQELQNRDVTSAQKVGRKIVEDVIRSFPPQKYKTKGTTNEERLANIWLNYTQNQVTNGAQMTGQSDT